MRIRIPGVTDELIAKDYYHGLIPREDVPELLKKNGNFLLRATEPSIGMAQSVVISVMCDQDQPAAKGQKHYVIRQDAAGRFHCERKAYDTIPQLIDAYTREGIPLDGLGAVTIKTPVKRKDWEHSHSDVVIGKKLGEGAYGEVCLGTLKTKPAAIKQNHMTKLTKDQIKEVMSEARVLRRVPHSNIVKLFGIAALDEPLLIIMELASNGSLDSYLKKNGPSMSSTTKAGMCLEVAWAMQHLKSKNILHRDLAVRNCLLCGDVVKLSDFGKSTTGPTYQMDPTEKLPIRWLAPETMANLTFTFGTEVWSFGIVCWEVFADGQEPYPGLMVRQVNEQVLQGHRMNMPDISPRAIKNLVEHMIWVPAINRADIGDIVISLERFTGRHQTNSEPKPLKPKKSEKTFGKSQSDKKRAKNPSDSHHSKKHAKDPSDSHHSKKH